LLIKNRLTALTRKSVLIFYRNIVRTFFYSGADSIYGTVGSSDYLYHSEDFAVFPNLGKCPGSIPFNINDIKPKGIKEQIVELPLNSGNFYKFRYGYDENCNEFRLAYKQSFFRQWTVENIYVLEDYWERLFVKAAQYGAGILDSFLQKTDTTLHP